MRRDALLAYPLASTPQASEVAHLMVNQFGPRADSQQAVTLRCDDITSLVDTVKASDAIYLGILGAARVGIDNGQLVELPTQPASRLSAHFAFVTLVGRTEAPARRFVLEQLRDREAPERPSTALPTPELRPA